MNALDAIFVGLGRAGVAGLLWIALAAVVVLARRRPPLLLAATALAVWSADLLALGLKAAVGRPRPPDAVPGLDALMAAGGSSFPSGHAATSFAGLVVLGAAVPRLLPLIVPLALAVAFSRVYVGVHYPTDVLAGAVLGAVVGWLVARSLLRPPRWRAEAPSRRRRGPRPG